MPESCCHAQSKAPTAGPIYLKRALVNILFTVPLIILNVLQLIPSPLTPLGLLIGLGLAVVTLVVMKKSGGEYYKSAFDALKKGKTNMHSLVALSTLIAFGYSLALCLFPGFFPIMIIHYHFAEIGMILGIVNLGRWQRAKAEDEINKKTQSYVEMVSKYRCSVARREGMSIPVEAIELGDILEIQPGERFPVEGVIVSGESWVDQKNITGESEALKKKVGDTVLSGTLNKTQILYVRASVKEKDSNLKKLLNAIQSKQAAIHSEWIDRITRYFIPIILSVAFLTAFSWLTFAGATVSVIPLMIQSVMSVLLCACPCAIGLAEPMSTSAAIHKLSEKGILVKNASAFEKVKSIKNIIFDKTGTLTEPVVETLYFPEASPDILNYVASLEKHHEKSHPIAKAIMTKASVFYKVEQPITYAQGMKGIIESHIMTVGSLNFCIKEGAKIDTHFIQKAEELNTQGQTTIFIVDNLRCVGVIGLKHQLSKGTKNQIEMLKAKGMNIGLLTGDKAGPAQAIARELGIDPAWVWAECSADQKQEKIKELKKTGGVAMVGDGMNDILACKEADVSFAIHAWTHAAVKCDVALRGEIEGINQFLDVSTQAVIPNIKQNVGWTFVYNTVALMGATGLLIPILSCALNPILATALMACSSIVVILNAKRLPEKIDKVLSTHKTLTRRLSGAPLPQAVEGITHSLHSCKIHPCEHPARRSASREGGSEQILPSTACGRGAPERRRVRA